MVNNLVEVFLTYNPMEASLVRAKLSDEEIPFTVTGDYNISISMETFNTELGRIALKRPIRFFVEERNYELAKVAINTDNSSLLKDDFDY